MKTALMFIIFLALNFASLALGSYFMDNGPSSAWYANLNKAPWTPPGWVFGVAWSTIMLAFALYMTRILSLHHTSWSPALLTYIAILALCVLWNAAFFGAQRTTLGLVILGALFVVVLIFSAFNHPNMGLWSAFMLPFILWLGIAVSLNAYTVLHNP